MKAGDTFELVKDGFSIKASVRLGRKGMEIAATVQGKGKPSKLLVISLPQPLALKISDRVMQRVYANMFIQKYQK